ncbi:MAG: phage holin family protein [Oscillospiraceae bacterium]|nr:phage holin family protein [Oscillospiraceae bacterium]MBR4657087.1 phage holin family protein [Oscillospiraceae bacterium]
MTHRIAIFSAASGVAAGVVSALVGGWDLALETLAIIMLLDYFTGLIVAGVFHKSPKSEGGALESKAAFKGLCKKALIVVIVVAFHQADRLTGKSFFRDGACWAFFIAEMISILENVGLIFPLPKFITKCLDWFKDKGDKLGDEINGKEDEK